MEDPAGERGGYTADAEDPDYTSELGYQFDEDQAAAVSDLESGLDTVGVELANRRVSDDQITYLFGHGGDLVELRIRYADGELDRIELETAGSQRTYHPPADQEVPVTVAVEEIAGDLDAGNYDGETTLEPQDTDESLRRVQKERRSHLPWRKGRTAHRGGRRSPGSTSIWR